ncbi:hypothetical protein KKF29_01725 [Patescibacteria group bacterium]|nr:hypothetical protein [Patescibacteria group bacterium]
MREKIVHQKEFRIVGKENPRRASRLEGKVKNRGIKNIKKKGKYSK